MYAEREPRTEAVSGPIGNGGTKKRHIPKVDVRSRTMERGREDKHARK
jgi:hypothetical protein